MNANTNITHELIIFLKEHFDENEMYLINKGLKYNIPRETMEYVNFT